MRSVQLLALAGTLASLAVALPTGPISKRVELYPAPDLGRIRVKDDVVDKRGNDMIYPNTPDAIISVRDDVEKREELYPAPDLGRIRVEDDVAE